MDERYGGIFLYEISPGGNKPVYIIAHSDRVRELLTNPSLELGAVENSEQVIIKRLGQVSIDSFTLDRLVFEANKVAEERAHVMGEK